MVKDSTPSKGCFMGLNHVPFFNAPPFLCGGAKRKITNWGGRKKKEKPARPPLHGRVFGTRALRSPEATWIAAVGPGKLAPTGHRVALRRRWLGVGYLNPPQNRWKRAVGTIWVENGCVVFHLQQAGGSVVSQMSPQALRSSTPRFGGRWCGGIL